MLYRLSTGFLIVLVFLVTAQASFAQNPNDFYFDTESHLEQIDAPRAWDFGTGSSDVVIAVIDTGVDIDHPDLKDNIWRNVEEIPDDGLDNDGNGYIDDINGWDFLENNNDPRPKIKSGFSAGAVTHGTIVAGAAGAVGNNGIGVTGVVWDVSIMPLRALDHTGSGVTTDVVKAIDYAIAKHATIINLSFVAIENDFRLLEAVQRAYEHDIVVVAAAGNEGEDHTTSDLSVTPHFPICYHGTKGENYVIGVAGINGDDTKARYSNFGHDCIDISAPGTNIPTTSFFQPAFTAFRDQYTDSWSGTSLSTPLVSGSIALLKSIRPDVSTRELAELLIANAEPIDSVNPLFVGQLGSGRLSLAHAVTALANITEQNTEEYIPESVRQNATSISFDKKLQSESITYCIPDTLIKSQSISAVYYCGIDGKRYVFPSESIFHSWYDDFSAVTVISDSELAAIPLGGNSTYRPGTTLVKLTTDPKVYVVDSSGTLRWVTDEHTAELLYGSGWNKLVRDLSDSFFTDYRLGNSITLE